MSEQRVVDALDRILSTLHEILEELKRARGADAEEAYHLRQASCRHTDTSPTPRGRTECRVCGLIFG